MIENAMNGVTSDLKLNNLIIDHCCSGGGV